MPGKMFSCGPGAPGGTGLMLFLKATGHTSFAGVLIRHPVAGTPGNENMSAVYVALGIVSLNLTHARWFGICADATLARHIQVTTIANTGSARIAFLLGGLHSAIALAR